MRRLTLWILAAVVLVFGAGLSLGWLIGSRQSDSRPDGTTLLPSAPRFWGDWVATGEDFWDDLAIDEGQRRELRRRVGSRREQMADLRAQLEELARETRDDVFGAVRVEQRRLAEELLTSYENQPEAVAEALREIVRLRDRVDLEVHQEASAFRILCDMSRQRQELFDEIRRRRRQRDEQTGAGSDTGANAPDWRKTGRERMRMIYALRDERLEKLLSAQQFAKHQEWVENCRKQWLSRKEDEKQNDGSKSSDVTKDPS